MAVSNVTNTSSGSSGSTAGVTATTSTEASDRFLKLLVAQMKNQDPLNPLDNAQVTSQMAQISTVTGIEKLNATVASLGTQFSSMQALQGVSLIGHDVTVPGDRLAVDEQGKASAQFDLSGAASSVKVQVLSSAGVVLDTIDLDAETAGRHDISWDASKLAADAREGLHFKVVAANGTTPVTATALTRDTVEAVSTSGDTLMVDLQHGGSLKWTDIRAFN